MKELTYKQMGDYQIPEVALPITKELTQGKFSRMREKYLNKIGIEIDYITGEINKRKDAKKEKNFELADQIRAELDSKGIILNDTVEGTTWDIKELY